MYESIYLPLSEAAELIARKLARIQAAEHPDAASALDAARRQLLRALFDGAVYSRGREWTGPPPDSDPNEPPSLPEPVRWLQIEPGWWSHERYEQYILRHQQNEFELLLLKGVIDTETSAPKLIEQIVEGAYFLDMIILSWNSSSFEVQGSNGDYKYLQIQVSRADLKLHFGIETTELQATELRSLTGAALPVKLEPPKRGRRPADVRTSVYDWLDAQPDGSRMCNSPYTELAHCYCTEVVRPNGELELRKCVDTIRKQVKNWCRERYPRNR